MRRLQVSCVYAPVVQKIVLQREVENRVPCSRSNENQIVEVAENCSPQRTNTEGGIYELLRVSRLAPVWLCYLNF